MNKDIKLYYIDKKYVRSLHNVDDNVPSVSPQIGKENRPFVGIIVLFNQRKYCIPLTSPNKKKFQSKSKIDFIKVFDNRVHNQSGVSKMIAVLNINNMIHVDEIVMKQVDLRINQRDSFEVKKRKNLMINELKWCRENYAVIQNRANKVYKLVTETPDKNRNLTKHCCKFKKLEEVLDKYVKAEGGRK